MLRRTTLSRCSRPVSSTRFEGRPALPHVLVLVAPMTTNRQYFQLDTMVSGGELGTERAALDFAMANTIRHFGFCGCGRPSEDGRIPLRYTVIETESHGPSEAVFLNVSASDGTILFDPPPPLYSQKAPLAIASCQRTRRPVLTLQSDFDAEADAQQLASFLATLRLTSLHFTGPSESEAPGIYKHVSTVLRLVFVSPPRAAIHGLLVRSESPPP